MLSRLPASTPGALIAQHIPPEFSKAFANRLNETCAMEVKEAQDGDTACGRAWPSSRPATSTWWRAKPAGGLS